MLTYFPKGNDVEKAECARCGFEYLKSSLKKQDGISVCKDCYDHHEPIPESSQRNKFTELPGRVV